VCVHVYSWTVLRSQCVAEESGLKSAETRVNGIADNCADEWCSDADDWDIDHDDDNICSNSETLASELIDSSPGSKPVATNTEQQGWPI